MVVERQARRRRHRVAARARRHAPQLGGRPVRFGEHGGAAGLGEQPAARRYAVEPRCGVALEGERRAPPLESEQPEAEADTAMRSSSEVARR